MDRTIRAIVDEMRSGATVDARRLDRLLRDANAREHDASRHIAKKRLLPFYLRERSANTPLFRSWQIDEATNDALVALLRAKPRRTASGVATITVLTKPWPCKSDCIYCPNDPRMPKSYLSDEPACQRAERCWFDPYLQVGARMRVLADMGHNTDKVELIVLGGTWSDYPESYRIWFVKELCRGLNDIGTPQHEREFTARWEAREHGETPDESCSLDELFAEQRRNETAQHRNVGLVVETRPDCVDREHLVHLRTLGCTKIQLGVQSLDPELIRLNTRTSTIDDVERAMSLLREFGFKSHVHIMLNLLGATPESDAADYLRLIEDERFRPDEVKLYPCALVESSRLMREYEEGRWRPYTEAELVDVLARDVLATPPYMRISRMIRDISSKDIVVGNKKTNLRQLVEREVAARAEATGAPVQEMRMREIATDDISDTPILDIIEYTTSNTDELFLQFVTAENRLAAFLRLSLPRDATADAMIREVHVYGKVSRLHEAKEGAQHAGLGRALVDEVCRIARTRGRTGIKVISAVGTRRYYASLGFDDAGLYQRKGLADG